MFQSLRSIAGLVVRFLPVILSQIPVQGGEGSPPVSLPPGFVMERMAPSPPVRFPMFATYDDRGNLYVAESSGLDLYAELSALTRRCQIRLLTDRNGDGWYESSAVFADNLVFPMGLVWQNGRLYVADPPSIIVLEDLNRDGVVERRYPILTGFGHKDNGSLHGLIFGPDGLLYMTMGHPDGYRIERPAGGPLIGESGALIRCRPDGTFPEVVCRGFENLIEIVFTRDGEMIGTDNWFQRPAGGVRDALVHLVAGGLYPLNLEDQGTQHLSTGEPLPALALFPAVALSGLALYEGQNFPPDMVGNLFSAQHNSRTVGRHELRREGSTYQAASFNFLSSEDPDFHPSDVLESGDGTLTIVDTGGWYVQHCPTGRIRNSRSVGGLFRVRYASATAVDDPWGLALVWNQIDPNELVNRLADSRPQIRKKAELALLQMSEVGLPALEAVLGSRASIPVKQRVLWLLSQIRGARSLRALLAQLPSPSWELAATAAHALAARSDNSSSPALAGLLNSPSLPVRRAAAEALGVCGRREALPAIWNALAGSSDRFLEHSLIYAAHFLAADADLTQALAHSSSRVQKAALILLDQSPGAKLPVNAVIERLSAPDPALRQAALRSLKKHPAWVRPAQDYLRPRLALEVLAPEEEAAVRDLILVFEGHSAIQEMVGRALLEQRGTMPVASRVRLLEILAQSKLPKIPVIWIQVLQDGLQDRSDIVKEQTMRTVGALRLNELDDLIWKLAQAGTPPSIRLAALQAVVARRSALSSDAFDFLLTETRNPVRPLNRLGAGQVLSRSVLTDAQILQTISTARTNSLLSPNLLLRSLAKASAGQTKVAVVDYLYEQVERGWRPDETVLRSFLKSAGWVGLAKAGSIEALLKQARDKDALAVAEFEPYLTGGDVDRGREIFFGAKVACASCHRAGAGGGLIGPDLTKIGAIRSGRDLLESIVRPSSTFAQGYENYSAVMKTGEQFDGLLVSETAALVFLRASSGLETRLLKDQIQTLNPLPVSIMPDGLANALTPGEFRDLLAFLQSLK